MAKRKTKPHGDPAAAANPVAEDNGAAAPIDPGAAASLESDDGPLPEELEPEPPSPAAVTLVQREIEHGKRRCSS